MNWLDEIGQDTPIDESVDALNFGDGNETQWQQDRLGKFTSSRLGDLMTTGRGKDSIWGKMAENYIYEKIAEKLTGVPHYIKETTATAWGVDHEEEAIDVYNSLHDNKINHMGKTFIKFNELAGGSPDGFIGEDGICEVKCPYNSANHIKTFITEEIDKGYFYQCQGNMLFSGRKWCKFISYDPRMPKEMQLKVIHIDRDDEICNQIAERITMASERMMEIARDFNLNLNINNQ